MGIVLLEDLEDELFEDGTIGQVRKAVSKLPVA